ncbi:MAG: sigma-E factor negative regulatory protein [Pseudomonadales bacterium]|nr:sigma-E factor negative regulatory protein [Pseudomonadales bacterium]
MKEQQQEMLSALFDGEASEFEIRCLLNELTDGDLEHWHRYQVISDASHNKLKATAFNFSVVDVVAAAIADEEAPSVETSNPTQAKKSRLNTVVGFVAAASVSFVAVLGINYLEMVKPGFIAPGNVSVSQWPISGKLGLNTVNGADESFIKTVYGQQTQDDEPLKQFFRLHVHKAVFENGWGLMTMSRMFHTE